MRPWALPIVGAVALSLAIPSAAQARLRFGPGAVLGAFAGAMFGGFRHAGRHHHRRVVAHASVSPRSGAHFRGRAAGAARSVGAVPQPPANPAQPPQNTSAQRAPERMAATFWPDAAADLADYVLLPSGNSPFWTHGYDSIVEAAFAASDAANQRGARARPAAPRRGRQARRLHPPMLAERPRRALMGSSKRSTARSSRMAHSGTRLKSFAALSRGRSSASPPVAPPPCR